MFHLSQTSLVSFFCLFIFLGAELYKRLSRYILSEDELKENGFPMVNPDKPSLAIIHNERSLYKKNERCNYILIRPQTFLGDCIMV